MTFKQKLKQSGGSRHGDIYALIRLYTAQKRGVCLVYFISLKTSTAVSGTKEFLSKYEGSDYLGGAGCRKQLTDIICHTEPFFRENFIIIRYTQYFYTGHG